MTISVVPYSLGSPISSLARYSRNDRKNRFWNVYIYRWNNLIALACLDLTDWRKLGAAMSDYDSDKFRE